MTAGRHHVVEAVHPEDRVWILPYKIVAVGSVALGIALMVITVVWFGGREDLRRDPLMISVFIIGLFEGILQIMVTKILCLLEFRRTLIGFIWLSISSLALSMMIFITMFERLEKEIGLGNMRWWWIEMSDRTLVIMSGITMIYKALFLLTCAVIKSCRRRRELSYLAAIEETDCNIPKCSHFDD